MFISRCVLARRTQWDVYYGSVSSHKSLAKNCWRPLMTSNDHYGSLIKTDDCFRVLLQSHSSIPSAPVPLPGPGCHWPTHCHTCPNPTPRHVCPNPNPVCPSPAPGLICPNTIPGQEDAGWPANWSPDWSEPRLSGQEGPEQSKGRLTSQGVPRTLLGTYRTTNVCNASERQLPWF